MADPLSILSPEKLNPIPTSGASSSTHHQRPPTDDDDMAWHDPPSSPFVSHLDNDQENMAPVDIAPTPLKQSMNFDEDVPQSAFKIHPSKSGGLMERASLVNMSPTKQNLDGDEDEALRRSSGNARSPRKSPSKQMLVERPESAMSNRSRKPSPTKLSRTSSAERVNQLERSIPDVAAELTSPLTTRSPSSHAQPSLRDNEGLTIAMRIMEEKRSERHESSITYQTHDKSIGIDDFGDLGEIEDTEFNPDGPEFTTLDIDDTCFSAFSEMPNLDMTKFAVLKKTPTLNGLIDQSTPRARAQMTPATVRRTGRTPSPTPRRNRKEHDTTTMLLDFTAQMEAFSTSRRGSPTRRGQSPTKSTTEPNLLSFYQGQRSPAKVGPAVPATPGQNRQMLNLLDFELPPPPTPRSVPTVTIRELESLKSNFQSQISSLTASLSGREAQVDSLVKAVADAERRVGETQETVREERSAREHAEAQMEDWKKKGEEVQNLLQSVQETLARNDAERESLLSRLQEFERRAEEAEVRSSELETRVIEAESKNVDMTTFINPDETEENRKIYSEAECQAAIAEKVNEVARDLHAAYKAKHEKKIKALKDNYQKKADEKCKELRVQIIRLEHKLEEAEKKRDDTFSKVLPAGFTAKPGACEKCGKSDGPASNSNVEDLKLLEEQKNEIQNLKAKLAGLESELSSIRRSHENLLQELEAERVEKGELVAAAEQMLALCGEKMEEIQQEELRKSTLAGAPPTAPTPSRGRPNSALAVARPGSGMGERLGAMGAPAPSGIAKPSGLRAPGGFGFQGSAGLNRSTSGGKSRLMSNIERMGGGKGQE